MSYKQIVQSNIASLNPTGTLDFNGTFQMNGNNNVVLNSVETSKNNLKKTQNNQVVCSSIENFENYNKPKNKYLIILFIFLIIILVFFLYYILYKKKS